MFSLVAGAAGVALQACVVQVSPPPGRGGPRRRGGRLASGAGGRFNARATSWGAALVCLPVCCSARGRMPSTRSGNLPQGGIVALEVFLAWYPEGCVLRMVASGLRVDAWRRRCWDCVGVNHAGLHEGIERVVVAVVTAG